MKHKVASLDALRGVLSMMVVVPHAWQIFVSQSPSAPNVPLGVAARLAVLCFFVLSGYVIAMSIAANRRRGAFSGTAYAMARVSRILPPLLCVYAIAYVMQIALIVLDADVTLVTSAPVSGFAVEFRHQAYALLSLGLFGSLAGGVNAPLWTLGIEIQLYVLAGLLAVAVWGSSSAVRMTAAFACVAFALHVERSAFTALAVGAFALGAVGFAAQLTARNLALPLAVAVGVALYLAPGAMAVPTQQMNTHAAWLLFQAACVVASGLLVALVSRLEWSIGASMGQWSYTLYILHFPMMLALWFMVHRYAAGFAQEWRHALAIAAAALTVWLCSIIGKRVERVKISIAFQPAAKVAPEAIGGQDRSNPARMALD